METVTLSAPDISCDHCKNAIEKAVGAMEGVAEVNVLVQSKQVVVMFDPDRVTLDSIKETMDEEGYPVDAWESGPAPAGSA